MHDPYAHIRAVAAQRAAQATLRTDCTTTAPNHRAAMLRDIRVASALVAALAFHATVAKRGDYPTVTARHLIAPGGFRTTH